MTDIETRIFSLLSEGEKHYTELKQVIVGKEEICSNQTLSNWLKLLEKDGKIAKELKSDRSTIYSLTSSYKNKGDSASDVVKLENLVGQLDNVFREEKLVEIKPSSLGLFHWLSEEAMRLRGIEHAPKLRFAFYLDGSTKAKIDLFLKTGEISGELKRTIDSVFEEIREKIRSDLETEYAKELLSWDDSKKFSEWLTSTHGMRGVILAFYDGKEYADRIFESLRKFNRLQKGHEIDIDFLDEVAGRCSIANEVYYTESLDWFYDKIVPDMRDWRDIYSYLEEAFIWYCWRADELRKPALETALISNAISELRRKGSEIPIAKEERVRDEIKIKLKKYDILDFDAYFKMKLPLLTENDKKKILKVILLDALAEVKNPDPMSEGKDWALYPEEYMTNITKLAAKVEDAEVKIGQKGIPEIPKLESEPILNYKFVYKGSMIDFSEAPMVINFKEYLTNPAKRNWLQKCLDLGLPLYTSLPLEKLGFRLKWII